jgi:hypothetical protein
MVKIKGEIVLKGEQLLDRKKGKLQLLPLLFEK